MIIEFALVVGYVVGTLLGIHFGFKYGVKRGASAAIDVLINNNFVKWRRVNGDIKLLEIDQ